MTADILAKIYNYVQARKILYADNRAYVMGDNPKTLHAPKEGTPDNRVPIPLAKMAVDDMCGYAGRGEDIRIHFEPLSKEPTEQEIANALDYEHIVAKWMDYNSDQVDTAELYREALSQGAAYQIWWVSASDDQSLPIKPEYKMYSGSYVYNESGLKLFSGGDVFVKWSDEIKPVKEYAVRFWVDSDPWDGEDDTSVYCDVYYPYHSERWVGPDWQRDISGDQEYPYSIVPVLEYTANKDALPIFNAEKRLIDAVDKSVGKSLNEIDRFNALILLLPKLATPEFKQKLQELQLIDDLNGADIKPEFLQKNLGGVTEFYKWILQELEDYFRKSIKIVDLTDQDFGSGDESGVAKLMKLLGMEYVAAGTETYFKQAIYERKQLFDDVINAGSSKIDTNSVTIEVDFKRNLPVDKQEAIAIATALKALGTVSDETIMRMLPSGIVDDVDKEMARVAAEREGRVSLIDTEEV